MKYYESTFFDEYNPLTNDEIANKITSARVDYEKNPVLIWEPLRIVLDDGTTLDYVFLPDGLTVRENGGVEIAADYHSQQLGDTVLFAHLIPGTLRALCVIRDMATNIVTVFDTWFGGYERAPREVWREIKRGCVEADGTPPPAARHELTNRIENAGFFWDDDDGVQNLVFTPSVMWSSYVEIGHPRGGITKTSPSDYFKINDHTYIYSRVDCEFSGEFTLEVIDMFDIVHVGVRLGFDLEDDFFFRSFYGEGELTGRGAQLEALDNQGTEIDLGKFAGIDGAVPPRGTRPTYRPKIMHKDFDKAETAEIIRTNSRIFEGGSIMSAHNTMPESDYIAGMSFTLRFDDSAEFEYDVTDKNTLKWRVPGGSWTSERYVAFEPAPDIIFFSHMMSGSDPVRNLSQAVDFSCGLSTCIDAVIGCEIGAWQIVNEARFGVVITDGITPPAVRRHTFTSELVGKAFSWTYGRDMKSIHVYSSPESYSWTIMLDNGAGGYMWSSPCIYVKLRDDAYLISWTEDNCNGNQGTIVFNPRIMHDAGFFFGIAGDASPPDMHLTTTGAYARSLGSFDILKYFGESK